MVLQAILADTFRVCEICLHRQNLGRTHLGGFFYNKICARFFDRGKHHPKVWRQHHRFGLALTQQNCIALAGLNHPRQPFTIATIEKFKHFAHAPSHHSEQIM